MYMDENAMKINDKIIRIINLAAPLLVDDVSAQPGVW